MSKKTYYNAEDLNKFGNISEFSPELGKKFFDYYGEVFKEGELTERSIDRISGFTHSVLIV